MKHTATEQHDGPRTAAVISAELEVARTTEAAIADKITQAQRAVDTASDEYNANINACILDGTAEERAHAPVDAANEKLESLRRIAQAQSATVANLDAELSVARRAETANAEREEIEALVASAELASKAFARHAAEAKKAESEVFDALFSNKTGLKRTFCTPELNDLARIARLTIRDRVITAAKSGGYRLNPDFVTDGNANYGHPERAAELRLEDVVRESERVSEWGTDPRDMGELVPEKIGELLPEGTLWWQR